MPRRRFVTIRADHTRDSVDLELPGDVPLSELLTDLIKTLNWPLSTDDTPISYSIHTSNGDELSLDGSLIDHGVENSDVLFIHLDDRNREHSLSTGVQSSSASGQENGMAAGIRPLASTLPVPWARRGTLAPPIRIDMVLQKPSLVNLQAGIVFVLPDHSPIRIGRPDRDASPDIDLTELDSNFVASRQHAEIHIVEGDYVLAPQKALNRTFVNQSEVNPGEERCLLDGDVIQFGIDGVRLTFRSGAVAWTATPDI